MVWVIKQGMTEEDLDKMWGEVEAAKKKKSNDKGFDAHKFNGLWKDKVMEDPLEIQKKLRDEWERDFN